jgi:hypothetical protein
VGSCAAIEAKFGARTPRGAGKRNMMVKRVRAAGSQPALNQIAFPAIRRGPVLNRGLRVPFWRREGKERLTLS